jgi:hypothetical protein
MQLAGAIAVKLNELSRQHAGQELKRLDVGVFPWHASIELSLLFVDDDCDERDIASWRYYDASHASAGRWPETQHLLKQMGDFWLRDAKSSDRIFAAVGGAMSTPVVQVELNRFKLLSDVTVTLYDPDNRSSPNYCSQGT